MSNKTKPTKTISSLEDRYIGQRLKLRRSQLGVSQTQLARFEKLTFQQIQKYESGVNKISSGRLYRLARILHVPINYFFEGIEDPTEEYDKAIHSDLRKLNMHFLKLKTPQLRNSVIGLARDLAKTFAVGEKKGKKYMLDNCKDIGGRK